MNYGCLKLRLCGASICKMLLGRSHPVRAKMASFSAPFSDIVWFYQEGKCSIWKCHAVKSELFLLLQHIPGSPIYEYVCIGCITVHIYILTTCSLFLGFRLFERGLAYAGTDYMSYPLWDKYIEYEEVHAEWGRVAMIYTRILEIPNRKLDDYFNR
jgi:hypothetical protein